MSFQALAQVYEEAHARRDIDALVEMVYVGDGPAAEVNRRCFRARFAGDLKKEIEAIRRTRLTYDDRDVLRHPTLKPRGNMRIDWVPDDEQTLGCATLYRYGKHNGVYYIVGTGPGAIEEELKDWTQGDHFTIKLPGVKQRAELALSRWRNKTVDPQPILFWATHSRPGKGPTGLGLDFYDEDMDVLGFGVEEHHINTNGTDEIYREEYPVYVHNRPWADVIYTVSVPIHIRSANERANVEEWDRYVRGDALDVNLRMSREDWEATLPPVWISRPEPNAVEVQVYLYDRAGHKSEPIPLQNGLRDN